MNDDIKYFKGTHRIITPSKTIENHESKLKNIGITRIADITDLDRIGMPVFTAIRPTAQNGAVSIYGGKGISKPHAKASAIMEAFERYSAEKQDNDEIIIGSINDISQKGKYIHPKSLNLPKDFKKEDIDLMMLEWSCGKDIISDENYYIPSNAIFHPYIPHNSTQSLFKSNTNGLASGNILDESILHGIYEVIERDAWSIFELTHKNYNQINIETIKSELIQETISKFTSKGINIKLMDFTADIKIPTIAASCDDTVTRDAGLLTLGMGTHLDPEVAVLMMIVDDNKNMNGTKRNNILNPELKFIGIDSTFIGKNFIAYFSFSK